ncbi:MAG: RNA-directed DNA polymerase [Anaerolineae bacterium]
MKTHKNLYPQIYTWDNLERAYRKARTGKRRLAPVADFEWAWESELLRLEAELREQRYRPGPYHSFHIHEPKKRLISAAPFRDRVVHHALCNIIEPLFERRFIFDSYANRRGKGTHRALDRCTQFARRYRYVLTCDVKQHFPSIDHAILAQILGRVIACPETMALIGKIIASGEGVLAEEYEMQYFDGDDLFAPLRPRGLPIGNLTSQFWSNCYVNPLDQFIKRELKCPAFIRYVDDMLLFADDLATLHRWRAEIIDFAATLRLKLHESRAQPRPVTAGIPFLGFVVYPDHRRLKGRKAVAARRRLWAAYAAYRRGELEQARVEAAIHGWLGHAQHGDTWGLAGQLLKPLVF